MIQRVCRNQFNLKDALSTNTENQPKRRFQKEYLGVLTKTQKKPCMQLRKGEGFKVQGEVKR